MKIQLVAAVAAAGLVALPATAATLHDNGLPNGTSAISNATAGVFGFRRTILDDFTIPAGAIWRIEDFHWYHLWNTLPPGSGSGAELFLWTDAPGAPGKPFHTMDVRTYAEKGTGRTYFSRPEAESWVTVEPIVLEAGTYWIEWTIIGPENNFAQLADLRDNECWVNYEDLGGLVSGSNQFGVASDLSWSLTGTLLSACTADLDGDGVVGFGDLLFVLRAWGKCAHQSGCPEDLDDSGAVDFADVLVVLGEWGGPCAPAVTGACCFADGTCDDVTHAVCRSRDGVFRGNETVCADGCPGACCFDDGACMDTTMEDDCIAMAGTFEGEGVTCTEVECPTVPVGACCLDDGTCLEPLSATNCAIADGRFQGGGSTCADVTCHVLGACGWIVRAPVIWLGNTCDEDDSCDRRPSRDVQWSITVPYGGAWTFSVCGAAADTILYADRADCCGDEFVNDDFCGAASQLTLGLISGETVMVTLETTSFIGCGEFALVVSSD